jgi:hypothetical protein
MTGIYRLRNRGSLRGPWTQFFVWFYIYYGPLPTKCTPLIQLTITIIYILPVVTRPAAELTKLP